MIRNYTGKNWKRSVNNAGVEGYKETIIVKYTPTGHWTDCITVYGYIFRDRVETSLTCGSWGDKTLIDEYCSALKDAKKVIKNIEKMTLNDLQ